LLENMDDTSYQFLAFVYKVCLAMNIYIHIHSPTSFSERKRREETNREEKILSNLEG